MSALSELFESLATRTWNDIGDADRLGFAMGETSITDFHMRDLFRAKLRGIRIRQAKGLDEARFGFDWEWWLGARDSWIRYSVQAKKLSQGTGKYDSLRQPVGKGPGAPQQIDVLDSFAQSQNSIPLYCFYNHLKNHVTARDGWNCHCEFDLTQLGCTLAPLHEVRVQHKAGETKTFTALHYKKSAIPWRCLFKCWGLPWPSLGPGGPFYPFDYVVRPRRLPQFLTPEATENEGELPAGGYHAIELPSQYYDSQLGGYPKRIAVFDFEQMEF